MLLKNGIPLTKTPPNFLFRIFFRTAAGLRMLRMFAGSVVDSALIVSALRRVVCQDALEAALACIAHKSLEICERCRLTPSLAG
jgi:hypothetical protein